MRSFTTAAFLVALLAPFTVAVPIENETILTPGGYRLKSDVHEIPAGGSVAHVGNDLHVLSVNGTVIHVVSNVFPGGATKTRTGVAPLQTGWVTYASWLNTGSSPISSFTTTWTVPPVPATNRGQTIFLFNSIEPNAGNAILQPVLQYGPSAAGGGSFWAVATWYLFGSSTTLFTKPVRVNVGATLNGIITLTGTSGSNFNYNSQFTNVGGTSLSITAAPQLTWATETLEAYGVAAKSDYPAGTTVFSNINLKLSNGAVPSVSWAHANDAADGLSTTINTNGATNARITIAYS